MNNVDEFSHFVEAQAPAYDQVVRELTGGCKHSHWMWFVFPQLRGLGTSWMSQRYALDSLEQARRYFAHDILGPRLIACTKLVLNIQGKTAADIFGGIDTLKFHSSVTLFSLCAPPENVFKEAIDKYFAGILDDKTLNILNIPPARLRKFQNQDRGTS